MKTTTSNRLRGLDIMRGIMILTMIIYHGWYLLANVFLIVPALENSLLPRLLTSFGWAIFVGIAGISAALTWKKLENSTDKKVAFTRYCLKRTAILAILAAVITFGIAKFEPRQAILFGILHFFAVAYLLLPIFTRHDRTRLALSIFMILTGAYLLFTTFPIEHLWIFGIRSPSFSSADYYPLFPYFWVILLGFSLGKHLIERETMQMIFSWDFPGSLPIRWLGKHSLIIYALHVPLLYGIIYLLAR